MNFHQLLEKMVQEDASDMFVTAKLAVSAKVNGELQPIVDHVLTAEESLALVHNAMNEKQIRQFDEEKECNFAISIDDIGRFRVSAFWQREMAGMVIRRIVTDIPDVDELGLPSVLKDVVMSKRGLVLFVGGTGTGKSTSMASLIGYRNRHSKGHILTIEDPVEFVHEHGKSMVTQREVGLDTESFDAALQSSLRQAPDVILIGEIRNQETMEHALSFAETGHLCIATLHANNANQAIDRIMHLVPADQHGKLLFDLALNLRGIIAQQLVPTKDGNSRIAAIEILLNSPYIAELIKK
ncbi:MAG: PilT/PilU family type 4a pilus ATPase, partial [Colwellia sp.]